MKRNFLVMAAMLMAVSCFAQDYNQTDSKGRRQGLWMDYYANGQKRYEGEFKNDRCTGEFRYYDEQGNLKATNTFDKSGEKALNKTYAPNGRVIATGYYLNQKKDGEWRYFDKDSGQLLLVEDNKGGKVDAYIYDDLKCSGKYDNLVSAISSETLKKVIYDLYQKGVEKGTVNVYNNNYCFFTPN